LIVDRQCCFVECYLGDSIGEGLAIIICSIFAVS